MALARLVLATRNPHKVGELQAILHEAGVDVSLVGMDAFPDLPDVVEDGLTFAANALKKARETSAATQLPCLADDSRLELFRIRFSYWGFRPTDAPDARPDSAQSSHSGSALPVYASIEIGDIDAVAYAS